MPERLVLVVERLRMLAQAGVSATLVGLVLSGRLVSPALLEVLVPGRLVPIRCSRRAVGGRGAAADRWAQ